MSEYNDVERRTVFTGKLITVRQDAVTQVDGAEKIWDVVEYPPAVAVVAVDENGDLLLVRQYRHAVETELLEIPAGGIDPGETPEEAVRREMQEETGFYPERIERLTGFYSAPGYSTEVLHLFLATELTPARLVAEDTDEITLLRTSATEIRQMIQNGQIQDSKSIAGLLFYLNLK
ncbi:MAG: NUDIX hydrolase [Dehalogenimonas sp.]|jgi:ADP-ribose pyrophosphatase|uniref:NUDIX hydrolase n=1 Tax=Candidatus Dehalogenimonas loeffleri TaxID=3127115 RepID=A0ABZ2J1V2_9CHLR|nr:NUDIX hydrolase [Dehalogenimonas sp.]